MADYKKPDHWSLRAQKEGYPARSVYKLSEIDEKFGLIKPGRSLKILDLGAAPGSWSLYILRKLPKNPGPRRPSAIATAEASAAPGMPAEASANAPAKAPVNNAGAPGQPAQLVSVDLSPLSREYDRGLFDDPRFLFIQGDFTIPEIREKIISCGPYNLIVSDAAPFTTGNRSIDTLRSLELAGTALDYAVASLAPGGNAVIKIFQGSDRADLLKQLKAMFKTGRSFKPQACRSESFETYFIGLGKKEC